VLLATKEAHDHGYYCLLENQTDQQAEAALTDFLAAHRLTLADLMARTVTVPPGWTADAP
jgi:hypothetical protein